jgi:hypothetical protein
MEEDFVTKRFRVGLASGLNLNLELLLGQEAIVYVDPNAGAIRTDGSTRRHRSSVWIVHEFTHFLRAATRDGDFGGPVQSFGN